MRQDEFQLAMQSRRRRERSRMTTRVKSNERFVEFVEQIGRPRNKLPKRRPKSPRQYELAGFSQDA